LEFQNKKRRKMLSRSFVKSTNPQNYRAFSTLLLTDPITHRNTKFGKADYSALAAALAISGDEQTHVLSPLGPGVETDESPLHHTSVSNSFLVTNHSNIQTPFTPGLMNYVAYYLNENTDITSVIAPSTSFYKDFLPQLAAKFNSQMISDVIDYEPEDNVYVRTVYAGNAVSRVKSVNNAKDFLTIRASNWDPVTEGFKSGSTTTGVDHIAEFAVENPVRFISEDIEVSERPDLGEARVVVSGGRGLKNGENFSLLEDLADALGDTAIGASRAAVDAGYCANDMQVGQTGKIVAPELYIAVGISGAIQHLAGMKDSKVRI
jgi:electron transfer flavoprotein alpha subunit